MIAFPNRVFKSYAVYLAERKHNKTAKPSPGYKKYRVRFQIARISIFK